MTRRLVFCALVTALAGPAFAAKPGVYPPLQIGVDSERPSVTRDDGRFDRTTLVPRALYRPAFTATPADAESMARQYLEARANEQLQLNLRAPGHELPYALEREGFEQALIFDSPGCDSQLFDEQQMLTAALSADLIFWVTAANRPDRQDERRYLEHLRTQQLRRLHHRPPPILAVVTHIDLLRPASVWQPPYNLTDPVDTKAMNIRAAVQFIARDLAIPIEHVIPVCLKPGREYNINDTLWASILDQQDIAMRVRLLRCLDASKRAEDWTLLRRQMISAGRFLWNLPKNNENRAVPQLPEPAGLQRAGHPHGMLKRKTFDENLGKILAGLATVAPADADSTAAPLRRRQQDDGNHWLAVVDVDHFKRVNDQFGHLYGDEVLLLLARIMRDSFRHQDKLFRFGGEEFVVILRAMADDEVTVALERFREAVENYRFPQVGQVTVSVGYTCIDAPDTIPDIVGRADDALYMAKESG